MKKFIKCLCLTLAVCVMSAVCFPLSAFADVSGGRLSITATKKDGALEVTLDMSDNPGFISANINVGFDTSVLKLKEVKDAGTLTGATHSNSYTSPYGLCWLDDLAAKDHYDNGTLATLTFDVLDPQKLEGTEIKLEQDIVNFNLDNVWFTVEGGRLSFDSDGVSQGGASVPGNPQQSGGQASGQASPGSDGTQGDKPQQSGSESDFSDSNLLSSDSDSPSLHANEGAEAGSAAGGGESENKASGDKTESGKQSGEKPDGSGDNGATADSSGGGFPIFIPIALGALAVAGGAAAVFFRLRVKKPGADEK